MNTINWHNVKMVLLILAAIVSTGISVLYPHIGDAPSWVGLIASILGGAEHVTNGNTSS